MDPPLQLILEHSIDQAVPLNKRLALESIRHDEELEVALAALGHVVLRALIYELDVNWTQRLVNLAPNDRLHPYRSRRKTPLRKEHLWHRADLSSTRTGERRLCCDRFANSLPLVVCSCCW